MAWEKCQMAWVLENKTQSQSIYLQGCPKVVPIWTGVGSAGLTTSDNFHRVSLLMFSDYLGKEMNKLNAIMKV